METDKFEQHIKTKLNKREISPSNEAWDKISEGLAVDKSSKKPSYFWIGIAASILVLIGTGFFFFNNGKNENSNEVEVVVTPVKKVLKESSVEKTNNVPQDDNTSIVLESDFEIYKDGQTTGTASQVVIKKELDKIIESDAIAVDTPRKEFRDSAKTIIVSENILNSKIAEVIAQVDALELSNIVTDAEVDSLLLRAQQDIVKENLFNPDNSVNAMALLTEVEDELDQSFRDQIFKSLKTGFLKVRTAVADRNN